METCIVHLDYKGQAVQAPVWVLSLWLMMEESIQQWREHSRKLLLLNNNSNWGGGVVEQWLAQVPHILTDQIMQL